MAKALVICLTAGLIWQFVLVVILVGARARRLSARFSDDERQHEHD